jgi:hypothetical protein
MLFASRHREFPGPSVRDEHILEDRPCREHRNRLLRRSRLRTDESFQDQLLEIPSRIGHHINDDLRCFDAINNAVRRHDELAPQADAELS